MGSSDRHDGSLDLRDELDVMRIERALEDADDEVRDRLILLPHPASICAASTSAENMHLEMMLLARHATVVPRGSNQMGALRRSAIPQGYRTVFRSLLGSTHPRALILGDVHNPNVIAEQTYHAAFGPHGGCGPWLWSCLPVETWTTLAVANANEEDIPALHRDLGAPPVVALGRNAAAACTAAGISCGVVPHPQHGRRFHHRRSSEYGELILLALEEDDFGGWPRSPNSIDAARLQSERRKKVEATVANSRLGTSIIERLAGAELLTPISEVFTTEGLSSEATTLADSLLVGTSTEDDEIQLVSASWATAQGTRGSVGLRSLLHPPTGRAAVITAEIVVRELNNMVDEIIDEDDVAEVVDEGLQSGSIDGVPEYILALCVVRVAMFNGWRPTSEETLGGVGAHIAAGSTDDRSSGHTEDEW